MTILAASAPVAARTDLARRILARVERCELRLISGLCVLMAALLAAFAPAAAAPFESDRIAVTVEGKGPDVILIPGLTSSPLAWSMTTPKLPGYRYHLVQVKGFAGTPVAGNASGPLLAPLADEIARYIAAQKLKAPAVVGHSMGGSVGLILAARHPQTVSKLMVVDMLPFMGAIYGPPGTTAESVVPIADAITQRMEAATPAEREQAMTAMTGSMVANEAMRPKVVAQALASDRALTTRTFRELIVTDLRPELAKIAAPTTVLYVTPKGAPVSDAQMDGYYAASFANLKGAKLVRVPNSAHFIMFDNPDFFREQLKAFLK